MCTGLEIAAVAALVVGTGATVYSEVEQGQQQKAQAKVQARNVQNQAAYDQSAAMQRADRIRRAAQSDVGTANATLAAGGVSLADGTPVAIKQDIYQKSEQDAANEVLTGSRRVATADSEANALRIAGNNAVTNSYVQAGSTIMGSYFGGSSGWRGYGTAGAR